MMNDPITDAMGDSVYQWTSTIINEALKQKTYQKALDWIDKMIPKVPDKFTGDTPDTMNTLLRQIYKDAKHEIYKRALAQKIGE